MAAPNVTAAARARGGRKELQQGVTGEATKEVYALPFVVAICAGDRSVVWGHYGTRDEGEAIAFRLRAHGINARTFDARSTA